MSEKKVTHQETYIDKDFRIPAGSSRIEVTPTGVGKFLTITVLLDLPRENIESIVKLALTRALNVKKELESEA